MIDPLVPKIIVLDQRKCRAWDIIHQPGCTSRPACSGRSGPRADQRPGECCLACSKPARERHNITGFKNTGQLSGQPFGRCLIRQKKLGATRCRISFLHGRFVSPERPVGNGLYDLVSHHIMFHQPFGHQSGGQIADNARAFAFIGFKFNPATVHLDEALDQ